jgi:uncharacterized protein (UPF0276 family)
MWQQLRRRGLRRVRVMSPTRSRSHERSPTAPARETGRCLRGSDRFGIGWRPELAAELLAHLDRIDVVEVLADRWLAAPRRQQRALALLGAQVPLTLHGVGLGLASTVPVAADRVRAWARLVDRVRPTSWSEHLAFVRGGGIEIGHLAAPPRNAATAAGAVANLHRLADAVGTLPLIENVATLLEPPGSDRDEATWIGEIVAGSGAPMLLDLHNLLANARNFGFDPVAFLDRIPVARVRAVHLAGGRELRGFGARRLLDDHLHDVPDAVFNLLTELGRRAEQPLDVILERDGNYPAVAELLAQLDRARAALAAGRALARESAA